MSSVLEFEPVTLAQARLEGHPVYQLRDLTDLRQFMEHHVFSVWDFMSLIKTLQSHLAPVRVPWRPAGDASVRRFINELVLEEESDVFSLPEGGEKYWSHFELYCQSMHELGADPGPVLGFVDMACEQGIAKALDSGLAPLPAQRFVAQTFAFIESGKPHVVAAALAVGREQVIPGMFRSFLADMSITADQAPLFHFYLNRHIHLDQDFHGPLSMRMLDLLCEENPEKIAEARTAALQAIETRIRFWDEVQQSFAVSQ